MTGMTVAVIGGGIGGTAAACAFAQRGADVTLYEQAPAMTEVGAGLQVSANGQKVLRALGAVGDTPPALASVSKGTVFRDGAKGRAVAKIPSPAAGPTWYMHRADALTVLVNAAQGAGVKFVLGRMATPGTVDAELVVAADGAHSLWRSGIDGPDSPRFTGHVAWRALVPWSGDVPTMASLTMGRKAHIVSYPLRAGSLMNIVCVEERTGWTQDSWSQTGDTSQLQHRFADFGGNVGEILARVSKVHTWALHARPVAQTWFKGNTVLLGDCAHPMLPFMAQGACMALEDAWVLADAVSASDTLERALATYVEGRRHRVSRVIGLAGGNARRFHFGKPLAWGAQLVLAAGAGMLARRLDWVYDYDATQVVSGSG
ncbi:MAG: FAD-dependent monooxygenase [Aliishimia sp.]